MGKMVMIIRCKRVKMILLILERGKKRGKSIASSQRMSCVMTTELLPLVYIYLHYICIKYG